MTGHLLGGAGGLEAGISVLALVNQQIPPTMNLENADPECRLDYVPNKAIRTSFDIALVEFIWIRRDQRDSDYAAMGVGQGTKGTREQGIGNRRASWPGVSRAFVFCSCGDCRYR